MIDGKIIAISGLMGSGKTTLCRNLAHKINWSCLPESTIAKNYLADFFNDLNRYAYPTQIAFLCNKALQIIQMLQDGKNIILDRSLYEDIYIFAKCWHDRGNIDDRDFAVYSNLADFFLKQIPDPQFILYCHCSIDEAKRRISTRDRQDQRNFPANHIDDINRRYCEWISKYSNSPIYKINTEQNDIRSDRVISQIVQDIKFIETDRQLSLFDYENDFAKPMHSVIEPVNNLNWASHNINIISDSQKKLIIPRSLINPWAYLAAPFTSVATNDEFSYDNQIKLVEYSSLHGKIRPGEYRRMLLSVEKKLKMLHIDTLIPHRDVNKWGNKVISPAEAASNCSTLVKDCDLFIGILGESSGSHYELGESVPNIV